MNIEELKRQARLASRATGNKLQVELNAIAHSHGHCSWNQLLRQRDVIEAALDRRTLGQALGDVFPNSRMATAKHLLITGDSAVGKSTLANAILAKMGAIRLYRTDADLIPAYNGKVVDVISSAEVIGIENLQEWEGKRAACDELDRGTCVVSCLNLRDFEKAAALLSSLYPEADTSSFAHVHVTLDPESGQRRITKAGMLYEG